MSEITPEVLTEAKADGWAEKDQWRGPPELWVDADEFVRRKNTVLPLLRKENQKLHDQLAATQTDLQGIKQNMQEFVQYQQQQTLAKLAEQRKQLLAERREADQAGDDQRVVAIEEQLEENAEAKAAAKVTKPADTGGNKLPPEPPELASWRAANPWFGTDDVKTGLAMGLGREAVKKGLTGQAYFDHINAGMKAIYAPPLAESKSEGGGPSGNGAPKGGTGKYASLPSDAKAQCDADAKRFVGPNKMFKDNAAWQAHFCNLYFSE